MSWSYAAAKAAVDSFDLSPINRQVAAYWLSLWTDGEPPRRAQFNPEWLKEAAAGIAIFDVKPGELVTCRFAGAAYKFRFGQDIAGKDWLALTRPEERATRLERNTAIVLGAVSTSRRRDPGRDGDDAWFGDLQLPFSNISEDGTRCYLHHSDWRPTGHELKLNRTRASSLHIADDFRLVSIRSVQAKPDSRTRVLENGVRAHESTPSFDGECVVVVDDDAAIREVLALHLEAAGLRVVALDSARTLLERGFDREARCIVSDIRMPDIDGLELQEELNQRRAGVPFIVVTAHGDIPLAVRAMRAGAIDVLEKPFRPAGLLSAIERALKRGSDAVRAERAQSRRRLESLTYREREVFELLAQGKPSRVIASALGVSQRTVDGHRANVMHKLSVKTVGELLRIAVGAE